LIRVEYERKPHVTDFDANERSRKSRDLEFLRDDQRHRLTAEQDFVIVKRTEGRAGRLADGLIANQVTPRRPNRILSERWFD
ncbi:hypothetical protein Q8G50_33665, partial [Klebsiella pneumoniae]